MSCRQTMLQAVWTSPSARSPTASMPLIACGGDGTVHCALQAVYGTQTVLGIIPVGTGDDIARALGLPRDDAAAAADVIADGAFAPSTTP